MCIFYNIGIILAGEFCGFFVLIIYAFITTEVVVSLVKSYALVAIGPIMFALGNSDFTKMAVTNYIRKSYRYRNTLNDFICNCWCGCRS